MNIIILGDKYRKGIKSRGCGALLKYNNKTIIDNQYSILKQFFPQSNIVYVYGFDGGRFDSYIKKKEYNLTKIHNPDYESKNIVHGLYLASEFLNKECMIMLGYNLLSRSIFNKFDTANGSQIFIDTKNTNTTIGCIIENNTVTNMSPDLNNNIADIYYLSENDSQKVREMLLQKKYSNYFIFELINKLINVGSKIHPYMVK